MIVAIFTHSTNGYYGTYLQNDNIIHL